MKAQYLILVGILSISGLNPGNVQAQIATYNFNNNLQDSIGGHHAIYLEAGVPSSKDAKYIPASSGFQILLDSIQGIQLPQSLIDQIDTGQSLEISFSFIITDVGSGKGFKDLVNCQSQVNEPGFSLYVVHNEFSSIDDYEILLSYSDGGFNKGVPNHPGHNATIVGTHLAGETIHMRLIMDFKNKNWTTIVNGKYTSVAFDDYYDWHFMLKTFKTNPWFYGWHEGQAADMAFQANIWTSSATLDKLVFYSPRQAGNTNRVITALQAMTKHVNGSSLLSVQQSMDYLNDIFLNYFTNHDLVSKEIFAFIQAYEMNYPPVYQDRNLVRQTDMLPESQLLIFLQQSIFDDQYTLEKVPGLAGIVFEFSEIFPGPVSAQAERITAAKVKINGVYSHIPAARIAADLWDVRRPTGYYAPPGEIVTITIPTSMVDAGLKVMIGAHDADHSSLNLTNRFNRMAKTYPLKTASTQIVSPFGGGIYVKVPESSNLGWFDVTISGAVKSPYFSWRSGRESNPANWQSDLTDHHVEWVDLESDKYMMTLPLNHIALVKDAADLMKQWDAIQDGYQYVGGRPFKRARAEYFLVDSRLPGNAFGTGYPQIIGDEKAPFGPLGNGALLPTQILNPNFWDSPIYITFHEMGHGANHPTLLNEVESIIHLNAVYIYQELYGLSMDNAFKFSFGEYLTLDEATMDWMIAKNFRTNLPMGCDPTVDKLVCDEVRYQHRGHAKYIQMAKLFGWSSVYEMNKTFYDNWNTHPSTDWMKVTPDNVIAAASYGSNVNMAPLMQFYGLHPSEALRIELSGLPCSDSILHLLNHYKDLTPNTAAEFKPWYDKLRPQKDPVHYPRYDATLANYDTDNYGVEILKQIDDLIKLYFTDCITTAIAEKIPERHLVFPNPTSGLVNIQRASTEALNISVLDINGRMVFEKRGVRDTNIQINLSQTPGVYFLSIKSAKEILTYKLIRTGD